jgi:hypothetical protein
VAPVLSHLGSGAQITLATLDAALAGRPNPDGDANRAVWAVWDAMTAREQADAALAANADLMGRLGSFDAATREGLRIDMGILPEPVDLATGTRFRLNEFALHSWDVRITLDPSAAVHPLAVPLLLDQVALMLGWIAKPGPLAGRTAHLAVEVPDLSTSFGLELGESISLGEAPAAPDGVLTVPGEAWLRLVSGRLAPARTPSTVSLTGDVTLDILRAVFPGF